MTSKTTILRLTPIGLIASAILFAGCVAPAGAGSARGGAANRDDWYLVNTRGRAEQAASDRLNGQAAMLEAKRAQAEQAAADRLNGQAAMLEAKRAQAEQAAADRLNGFAKSLEAKRAQAEQAAANRLNGLANSLILQPPVRDDWYRNSKTTFQIERDWDVVEGGPKVATSQPPHPAYVTHVGLAGLTPSVGDNWYAESTAGLTPSVRDDWYR